MEYFLVIICVLNTLLLIGVAGSIAKIIAHIRGEAGAKEEWAQAIKQRQILDKQSRQPNYTETEMIPNWDGIPKTSNWDGVGKTTN